MASERTRQHLLSMIETMQREGRTEAEITRAVRTARGEAARPERRPLRKAVSLGRWRLEVARLK